jgi:hypothetical protein
MKRLLLVFVLTGAVASAENLFPGIKGIMSPEEQRNSGIANLTTDQLALIDLAILRHYAGAMKTQINHEAAQMAQKMREDDKASFLARFGLPDISFSQDWRDLPGVQAKVLGWVGGNSFRLDNGQVWQGVEPISVELVNRQVEISPRPGGHFNLSVEGKNTTIRVIRVK